MINDVLALSIFLVVGYVLGRVLERLRLPALIGYILVGLLLGPNVLGAITEEVIADLDFVSVIALGLIAFIIGGRIRIEEFRGSQGRMFLMAFLQAMISFCVISLGVLFISGSLSLALILGAIGTATAPAAVFGVIEEYHAKGPLTRSLLSIVAIDDAICLIIFGIVVAITSILLGGAPEGAFDATWRAIVEIAGALGIGAVAGGMVTLLVSRSREIHRVAYIAIGFVFLGTGLAISFGISELLTTMATGFVVANLSRQHAEQLFGLVERAEEPILIIFFSLAGAQLELASVAHVWPIFAAYLLARTLGKLGGGFVAGYAGHSAPAVRRYLGLGLLPQAGVSIGLVYVVQEKLPVLAEGVVAVVLAAILIFEFVGPVGVEIALFTSKEAVREPGSAR